MTQHAYDLRTHDDDTFELDLEAIRAKAAASPTDGAIVDSSLSREAVVAMLQDVLATELVCYLRYLTHAHQAEGIKAAVAAAEFREHAEQERSHMERVAERISQLGGTPDMDPATCMERSHAPYAEATDLEGMLRENAIAERVAVQTYSAMISHLRDRDPTTRRLLESILAEEEHHADEMASLLRSF